MREASADRLMSDLRAVLEDAEALLTATAGQAGEKIQRARKEVKDKLSSVWGFDYLVLLPSDSTARTKVAFIKAGNIIGFEDFEAPSLADSLPDEVARRFSGATDAVNYDWQYDEFCLVANYLVHPLKSVELVRVEAGMDLAACLKKRERHPPVASDS